MACEIKNLTFGSKSKNGIEKIELIYRNGKLLSAFMSGGVITNLFLKNGALTASYSISQYDFRLFAQAMQGIPNIIKNRTSLIASELIIDGTLTYQEREFWKCFNHEIYN